MLRACLALCSLLAVGACLNPQASKPSMPAKGEARDLSKFELAWREDFDPGLGQATLGDWTFDTNMVEFQAQNATLAAGQLSLHLTERKPGEGKTDRKYMGAEYDRTG